MGHKPQPEGSEDTTKSPNTGVEGLAGVKKPEDFVKDTGEEDTGEKTQSEEDTGEEDTGENTGEEHSGRTQRRRHWRGTGES